MRTTAFGDKIIESINDDLGDAIMDHEPGTIYATIRNDGDVKGKFWFEIQENENGEEVAQSDEFFDTANDARAYLSGWLDAGDIQQA